MIEHRSPSVFAALLSGIFSVPHDSCKANDQTPGYETMTSMDGKADAGW